MKVDALWITGKGRIEVRATEINDQPAYDEVQVEMSACGICAWDCALFQGISSPGPFPFQHGHEGIGYIRKTGAGIHDLKTGDLVMCTEDTPQMIQLQNIKRAAVCKIYEKVPANEIRLWIGEPIVCVVNSLANLPIQPGTEVVLIGSGYMGLLNIQGLARTLIGSLTVFDLDENRLKLAKAFGADETYVIGSEAANRKIADIKQRGGAGLAIECSGASKGLELASELMAPSGILDLFAWHRTARTIDMTPWHTRGYRIFNTSPCFDPHFRDHITETEILMRKGVFNQKKLMTHSAHYMQAQDLMELAASKSDGYIKGAILF